MAKIVPRDWQQLYAHPLYWLETFVDPARFKGTCYRAANWQSLTGLGSDPHSGIALHWAPKTSTLDLPVLLNGAVCLQRFISGRSAAESLEATK
jgi:hypothetical protein